jgi:hypothetical protein
VVRFYNKRGTAGQWIKEGKQAVKMTRLSCHLFRSTNVRYGSPNAIMMRKACSGLTMMAS